MNKGFQEDKMTDPYLTVSRMGQLNQNLRYVSAEEGKLREKQFESRLGILGRRANEMPVLCLI
jgi:hypothetical protein